MRKRPLKNEKGIALILVLWGLVLLIALGSEFAFSMRTELNTTRNHKEDIEAYHLAKSGINLAFAEILTLSEYHSWTESKGFIFAKPIKITGKEEENPNSFAPVERENISLGRGSFSYKIEDENGKINLNTATRETLVKIFEAAGIESGAERDTMIDSILDWIDPDDNHRINGAEKDYYRQLSPPVTPKNGPLNTLDELLKVKGMTPEILFGQKKKDLSENESEDSDEETDDVSEDNAEEGAEKKSKTGLSKFLTVQNIQFFNPNTADPQVLSVVYPAAKVAEVLKIKEEREYYAKALSSHFKITSSGKLQNSRVRHTITTIVEKSGIDQKSRLLIRSWKDNVFKP